MPKDRSNIVITNDDISLFLLDIEQRYPNTVDFAFEDKYAEMTTSSPKKKYKEFMRLVNKYPRAWEFESYEKSDEPGKEAENTERFLNANSDLPVEIRNSGDIGTLEEFLTANANNITYRSKAKLLKRLETLDKKNEIEEKAKTRANGKEPFGDRPKLKEKDGKVSLDVHMPKYQTSSNGCWSCGMQMLLQGRGIKNVTQEDIRSFRPNYGKNTLKGRRFVQDHVIDKAFNDDDMQNVMDMGDIALNFAPDSMLRTLDILRYPEAETALGKKFTPEEKENYRRSAVKLVKDQLRKVIHDKKSPVTVSNGSHYITITGIQGDYMFYKSSTSAAYDAEQPMLIEDYVSGILDGVYKAQFVWMEDIELSKDGKTFYNVPSNSLSLNPDGTLHMPDPLVQDDANSMKAEQEHDGFRVRLYSGKEDTANDRVNRDIMSDGVIKIEQAYFPKKVNAANLKRKARDRKENIETKLRNETTELLGYDPLNPSIKAPKKKAAPAESRGKLVLESVDIAKELNQKSKSYDDYLDAGNTIRGTRIQNAEKRSEDRLFYHFNAGSLEKSLQVSEKFNEVQASMGKNVPGYVRPTDFDGKKYIWDEEGAVIAFRLRTAFACAMPILRLLGKNDRIAEMSQRFYGLMGKLNTPENLITPEEGKNFSGWDGKKINLPNNKIKIEHYFKNKNDIYDAAMLLIFIHDSVGLASELKQTKEGTPNYNPTLLSRYVENLQLVSDHTKGNILRACAENKDLYSKVLHIADFATNDINKLNTKYSEADNEVKTLINKAYSDAKELSDEYRHQEELNFVMNNNDYSYGSPNVYSNENTNEMNASYEEEDLIKPDGESDEMGEDDYNFFIDDADMELGDSDEELGKSDKKQEENDKKQDESDKEQQELEGEFNKELHELEEELGKEAEEEKEKGNEIDYGSYQTVTEDDKKTEFFLNEAGFPMMKESDPSLDAGGDGKETDKKPEPGNEGNKGDKENKKKSIIEELREIDNNVKATDEEMRAFFADYEEDGDNKPENKDDKKDAKEPGKKDTKNSVKKATEEARKKKKADDKARNQRLDEYDKVIKEYGSKQASEIIIGGISVVDNLVDFSLDDRMVTLVDPRKGLVEDAYDLDNKKYGSVPQMGHKSFNVYPVKDKDSHKAFSNEVAGLINDIEFTIDDNVRENETDQKMADFLKSITVRPARRALKGYPDAFINTRTPLGGGAMDVAAVVSGKLSDGLSNNIKTWNSTFPIYDIFIEGENQKDILVNYWDDKANDRLTPERENSYRTMLYEKTIDLMTIVDSLESKVADPAIHKQLKDAGIFDKANDPFLIHSSSAEGLKSLSYSLPMYKAGLENGWAIDDIGVLAAFNYICSTNLNSIYTNGATKLDKFKVRDKAGFTSPEQQQYFNQMEEFIELIKTSKLTGKEMRDGYLLQMKNMIDEGLAKGFYVDNRDAYVENFNRIYDNARRRDANIELGREEAVSTFNVTEELGMKTDLKLFINNFNTSRTRFVFGRESDEHKNLRNSVNDLKTAMQSIDADRVNAATTSDEITDYFIKLEEVILNAKAYRVAKKEVPSSPAGKERLKGSNQLEQYAKKEMLKLLLKSKDIGLVSEVADVSKLRGKVAELRSKAAVDKIKKMDHIPQTAEEKALFYDAAADIMVANFAKSTSVAAKKAVAGRGLVKLKKEILKDSDFKNIMNGFLRTENMNPMSLANAVNSLNSLEKMNKLKGQFVRDNSKMLQEKDKKRENIMKHQPKKVSK